MTTHAEYKLQITMWKVMKEVQWNGRKQQQQQQQQK